MNFGLQLGPRGGVLSCTFCVIFVPGAPLGTRMAPRPIPRASGTPRTSLFHNLGAIIDRCFFMISGRFLAIFPIVFFRFQSMAQCFLFVFHLRACHILGPTTGAEGSKSPKRGPSFSRPIFPANFLDQFSQGLTRAQPRA